MEFTAKVRYIDYQGRSHYTTVKSDYSDRNHIEDIVYEQYPAEDVYVQGVYSQQLLLYIRSIILFT